MSDPSAAKFDAYAGSYEAMHAASIAASGEPTEYFAKYKLDRLARLGARRSGPIVDFGCGTGNLTEQLVTRYDEVHAFDPSSESVEVAKRRAPAAQFHLSTSDVPERTFELAVLSGVLHHVPPGERAALLTTVFGKLRPGGRIVVFEHNPLNPVTRHAVATCPFDDDAVLLWPWEAKRSLARAGFRSVRLDYIVFFPRPLSFLRRLEPRLDWLFLGAQTMTVGTRPA